MATGYSKNVFAAEPGQKTKSFDRAGGCKGVVSFVRYKLGEWTSYLHRHKIQEEVFITLKGRGSIILDGRRIAMPEGTIVGVGAEGLSRAGQ